MKVTSRINQNHISAMNEIFQRAQIKTCDAIKSDLQKSQTLPRGDTGELQKNIFVFKGNMKRGIVRIMHTNLLYPRRLYFHPEYNFRKDKNPNAGGLWFEPYLPNGKKGKMPQITFTQMVRKEMENVISKY